MTFDWLNPPPAWDHEAGVLHVTTGENTDFWRRTHYGFIRDDGHFRFTTVTGDFTAEVSVAADYSALYDQAGLMLRVDHRNWIKTGIEYTDGGVHFSTVVTREDFSDWSQQRLPDTAARGLDIRLTRHGEALRVQFRLADGPWTMARLAMLPMADAAQVGMMCCTPQRAGLHAVFTGFQILPAIGPGLHD